MASTSKQNDGNHGSDQKRRKIGPTEGMNITDLIEDCQEKIFNYLNFESLVNVVISSPCLRVAAKTAIKRKYGHINTKAIQLIQRPDGHATSDEYSIEIYGPKKCLQFVRCFGDNILKVEVKNSFYIASKYCKYIDQYISQFCGDHLIDLNIFHSLNPLANIEKPFKNVLSLGLSWCHFGQRFQQFPQLFPELCRLRVSRNYDCTYDGTITIDFLKLKHLQINNF